jgi:glycosyltransferase involved in cell wall biosynthesis
VNARCLHRPVSGVERYAGEVVRRFSRPVELLSPRTASAGLAGHLWEQLVLPGRARRGVLWSPANTGPIAVSAQAVTIHDIAPLDHPGWYRPLFAAWYRWLWPRLTARAHTIVTDSAFSRARIEARLNISPNRVVVIPVGVDASRFTPRPQIEVDAVRSRYGLPARYVLFVGSVQPRKNLSGLAEAVRMLETDFAGIELVVAGERSRHFAPAGGSFAGTHFLGRVPEDHLPALYSGAEVFVQPSFYEGGGLTVLEALACGCPVAAARGSALDEYLGNAGLIFEPKNPADISSAIGALLGDESLRLGLREAGIERARDFSWAGCAAAIEAVLEAIPLPASP